LLLQTINLLPVLSPGIPGPIEPAEIPAALLRRQEGDDTCEPAPLFLSADSQIPQSPKPY
jgi:hypothetical protein